MAENKNVASEALRQRYDSLATAIAQPALLDKLASKLYNAALIVKETRDYVHCTEGMTPYKKAVAILKAVECTIAGNSKCLRRFVRVLKKEPTMQTCAERLYEQYRTFHCRVLSTFYKCIDCQHLNETFNKGGWN